jgi:hypothetical protein
MITDYPVISSKFDRHDAWNIGLTVHICTYRGADKSLASTGRKQATAREDFDVHISYL